MLNMARPLLMSASFIFNLATSALMLVMNSIATAVETESLNGPLLLKSSNKNEMVFFKSSAE